MQGERRVVGVGLWLGGGLGGGARRRCQLRVEHEPYGGSAGRRERDGEREVGEGGLEGEGEGLLEGGAGEGVDGEEDRLEGTHGEGRLGGWEAWRGRGVARKGVAGKGVAGRSGRAP